MAAAEWASRDGFDATQSHLIVETLHRCADVMDAHVGLCSAGAVDERIRDLLRENNEPAAHGFARLAALCFGVSEQHVGVFSCTSPLRVILTNRDIGRSTARLASIYRRSGHRPSTRDGAARFFTAHSSTSNAFAHERCSIVGRYQAVVVSDPHISNAASGNSSPDGRHVSPLENGSSSMQQGFRKGENEADSARVRQGTDG